MKRSASIILGIICSIVLGLSIWLILGIVRQEKLDKGFSKVKTGATQLEVIRLLGRPTRIGRCGDFFHQQATPTGCVSEYVYSASFAPLVPQYYVVSFDDTGRVLEATNWSSP
jgi:hypothetical protein